MASRPAGKRKDGGNVGGYQCGMITERHDTGTIQADDRVSLQIYHGCDGDKKQEGTKMIWGGQNLQTMKAVADSEDHIQETQSADCATGILTACFPLPTREEGTAAIMSWGMDGSCTGLRYQPAIHRGSEKKRQNPGMVWKAADLTCDPLESCLDLRCRDCFKGWKPLV